MKKFDIKSLILGIGIGMIVTSILGLVYASGYMSDNKNKMEYNNSVNSYYSTVSAENGSDGVEDTNGTENPGNDLDK